jgi:dihydrodipicolinate synthase/N-acetylneuraminate lyase
LDGQHHISGVWAAAVTPRRENGHAVDIAAALDVLDFLAGTGVKGLALLGSTGEFIHFGFDERVHLMKFALKRTTLPAYVSVTHSTLDATVALGEAAMDYDAAGLLIMPPYYFRYGPDDLRRFFFTVAEELAETAPLYLYNIPFFSTPIPVDLACELLAQGVYAGIKDSSGDKEYCRRLLGVKQQRPETRVIIGNDALFAEGRRAGADGVVSGVAGALPEVMLELEAAIAASDEAGIEAGQARLAEVLAWLDKFPVPMALKRALELRGLKGGRMAIPMDGQFTEFDAWFQGFLRP